tara:strand:- start:10 stop:216 length:207 start_codon:yes stop_codon:yes gene_type:complete
MINIERIDAIMAQRGIKYRKDLAEKAGLQPHQISNLLNGIIAPSLRTVDRICTALECQPGDFLRHRAD